MPKPHPKKPHEKGVGTQLVAPTATDFLELFINGNKENKWAIEQMNNEGPEHKQVLNAMLLQQLATLVKALETRTGSTWQLQPGETIVSHKHEKETTIPVPLPLGAILARNKEAILETIARAPEHEVLLYAILQQVTTWGTQVLAANN